MWERSIPTACSDPHRPVVSSDAPQQPVWRWDAGLGEVGPPPRFLLALHPSLADVPLAVALEVVVRVEPIPRVHRGEEVVVDVRLDGNLGGGEDGDDGNVFVMWCCRWKWAGMMNVEWNEETNLLQGEVDPPGLVHVGRQVDPLADPGVTFGCGRQDVSPGIQQPPVVPIFSWRAVQTMCVREEVKRGQLLTICLLSGLCMSVVDCLSVIRSLSVWIYPIVFLILHTILKLLNIEGKLFVTTNGSKGNKRKIIKVIPPKTCIKYHVECMM